MTAPELTAIVAGVGMLGGIGGWLLKARLNGGSLSPDKAQTMVAEIKAHVTAELKDTRHNLRDALMHVQAEMLLAAREVASALKESQTKGRR